MRTILTERLRLEPVTRSNSAVLWSVLQHPDLREYQDLPDVDAKQFAGIVAARPARLERGGVGRFEWLIFLEGIEPPVGWVSLRIGDRFVGTAEVGYSVLREYRNRGIAGEALSGLIDESFAAIPLKRLRAYCVPENTASRAVLDRIGFLDDGILPHGATVQGQSVDVITHLLERERWEALRIAR